MMIRSERPKFRIFSASTRRLWLCSAVALVVLASFGMPLSAAEPDDGGRGPERYDDGRPGTAPQQRDDERPYEDGTDEEGEAARPGTGEPEQVPGCRFRNGPLELVV